jgi:thiol:disulfide interchange protein
MLATTTMQASQTETAMWARCAFGLWGLLLAAMPGYADTDGTEGVYVPLATDLAADGKLAREKRVPILVLMAAEYCTYCKVVEKDFLKPMMISGQYQGKVLMRVLYIDGHQPIKDFDGAAVSPQDLAARYRVQLTPTVLFLGPNGQELAERLVGISSRDFYGAYVDRDIDTARSKLRAPS